MALVVRIERRIDRAFEQHRLVGVLHEPTGSARRLVAIAHDLQRDVLISGRCVRNVFGESKQG